MKRKSFTLVEAAQASALAVCPRLGALASAVCTSTRSSCRGRSRSISPRSRTRARAPRSSRRPVGPRSNEPVSTTLRLRPPNEVGSRASTKSPPPTTCSRLHGRGASQGRADIERNALLACRSRFKGQPAAARAAYLLGRSTGAGEAASWFETYIREQPAGALAREASGRLIESQQRAGNVAATREAASRYLATYPDGPHASLARQVLAR